MADNTMSFLYGLSGYEQSLPMSIVPSGIYDTKIPKTDDIIAAAQQPAVYVSPDDRLKYGVSDSGLPDPNAKIEYMTKGYGTRKPTNSDIKEDGGAGGGASKPSMTEDQVEMYGRAASYLTSSVSDFANGFLAYGNSKFKVSQYEFSAQQNERAARLLEANIKDINRAAQMDASVYKIQRSELKSKQKTAMAASGFAVGKGSYKAVLDTTDARTNYNVAMRMLKADLQTAETLRKAGTYRAQAEIERGNAEISRRQGKAAMYSGIIGGVGNLINSGFSFYVGKWGLEGASDTTSRNSGGKK